MDKVILIVNMHLIKQVYLLLLEKCIRKGRIMIFAYVMECYVVWEAGTQIHAFQLLLDDV